MTKTEVSQSEQLVIFYDGLCPLCVAEMKQLDELDKDNRILFENVQTDDFEKRYPNINPHEANQILHGLYRQKLILGLDVTYQAWKIVGKKKWIAMLRWPIIRWFADKAYLVFAKHRYRISFLLTGKERLSLAECQQCQFGRCSVTKQDQ